jgi:hypothetical protein
LDPGPSWSTSASTTSSSRAGREDQQVLVEGVELQGDPVDGVYPSDHRAVVADLRWRD